MRVRRCDTCAWFTTDARERSARTEGFGECRRSAPSREGWPVAKPEEWCGDWYAAEIDDARGRLGG